MTTPQPPGIGDLNWGTELNNYLTNTIQAGITSNQSELNSHVAGAPATATSSDPHGDRAYAQSIIVPLTQNVNKANGFLQLNPSGQVPLGTWQDLRPVATGFGSSGTTVRYPPQYLVTLDGSVRLAGYFFLTSETYNGQRVFVNALPPTLIPLQAVDLRVTLDAAGTTPSSQPPMITIGTDGSVTLNGCPAGLAAGTAVGIYGEYPLDAYYSMIQS